MGVGRGCSLPIKAAAQQAGGEESETIPPALVSLLAYPPVHFVGSDRHRVPGGDR